MTLWTTRATAFLAALTIVATAGIAYAAGKSLEDLVKHEREKLEKHSEGIFYFTDSTAKGAAKMLLVSSDKKKEVDTEYLTTAQALGNNFARGIYSYDKKKGWTFTVYEAGANLSDERFATLTKALERYMGEELPKMKKQNVGNVKADDQRKAKEATDFLKKFKLPVAPKTADTSLKAYAYKGAAGIEVYSSEATDPTFHLTVFEQLDLLKSKPVGKLLLEKIDAATVKAKAGYKIRILRADSTVTIEEIDEKEDGEMTKRVQWHAGNTTFGHDMSKAFKKKDGPNVGTPSLIKYNPNVYETPDGKRPPFIGLAHELIHAYNNLYGISEQNKRDDEAKTSGMKEFKDEEICENKIRAEHKVDARTKYTGVVED